MSNTDGEDTQKVSLGELLLNAGTRIVDLEKQSNDHVEIITHLEKQLASLREKLAKERGKSQRLNDDLANALDVIEKKEVENGELINKIKWMLTVLKPFNDTEDFEMQEIESLISRLSAKLGK